MDIGQSAGHPHVDALRRYVVITLWLVAAGAATTLGLDLEGDGLH